MHRTAFAVATLLVAGCSAAAQPSRDAQSAHRPSARFRGGAAQRVLGLPPVRRGPLPGYLLIADRNNNRAIIVSPRKQIVWTSPRLNEPDDAFFVPGYRSIITNEEFDETLTEVSLSSGRRIWHYGHAGVAGSSSGYLNSPDDAYRLRNGTTSVSDIHNCRIVLLSRASQVLRVLGGSCTHDPPRAFASPNGDTPLPDGGLLVTEIGGWIDRLDARGRVVWSMRSPVTYPSDAQLLPNGRILVASFTNPGKIVELTRRGRVTWSFGAARGPDRLAKPSLAVRLPNGLIAANDDYKHRVILIDPKTKRIVWQYGHTGVAGSGPGYLNKPDGIDLLPSATSTVSRPAKATPSRPLTKPFGVSRIGTLPQSVSRLAAVALPDGRIVALGGLSRGASSDAILAGRPDRLVRAGRLPLGTHDAAAVSFHGAVYLYGGGQAASSPAVVRIDPATGAAREIGRMSEPLSDLGAVTAAGRVYLVGGYTGTRYATAVLLAKGSHVSVVARLPQGLRYAGVAALGGRIYVAGGVTPSGETSAIRVVDPLSHTVRRLGTLPRPLAHAPLVAVGKALYLVGGRVASGNATRTIIRIDPATGSVRNVGHLPVPLADSAAVTAGSRVIVLGGTGTFASASVYAFRP